MVTLSHHSVTFSHHVVYNSHQREKGMNRALFSELFGGKGRLKALRLLYSHPGQALPLREFAAAAGIDHAQLHRLLKRWAAVGLAQRIVHGKSVGYRASDDPALRPLVSLFKQHDELVDDIRAALPVSATYAAIVGSYARGTESAQSDVDVLVVANASEIKTNAALKPVARKHGRSINATVMRANRFRALVKEGDSFVLAILDSPRIELKGQINEFSKS